RANERRLRCRRLPATASPFSELHSLVARDRKGTPQAAARVPPAHCRLQRALAAYLAHVQDEDAAGDLLAAPALRLTSSTRSRVRTPRAAQRRIPCRDTRRYRRPRC